MGTLRKDCVEFHLRFVQNYKLTLKCRAEIKE